MRLIDADAFSAFIKKAVRELGYDGDGALRICDTLTVGDVLNSVCAELDGTALEGLKNAPTVDAVPVEAYKQVRWERDIAMQQLDALGYGLGEKVVPVVHGRWIVHYGNWADVYECDQCHHTSKDGGKYCSNCGVRMDGKQL